MLTELTYKVNGQSLEGHSFKMASDTVNEIQMLFSFEDDKWNGLDLIKAIFSNSKSNGEYEKVLSNNSCVIPHEVLMTKGRVEVNLVGYVLSGQTLTRRITSFETGVVDVLQKVKTSGNNSIVPTPQVWEQALSAETQARQTADTSLQNLITAETSARQSADTSLQNLINAEATARQSADDSLEEDIEDEAAARQAQDNALSSAISSETTARQSADTALGVRIDTHNHDNVYVKKTDPLYPSNGGN